MTLTFSSTQALPLASTLLRVLKRPGTDQTYVASTEVQGLEVRGPRSPGVPGTERGPNRFALSPSRAGRVQGPHLQHHAAEWLPIGAHVQVHERVPGGGVRVSCSAVAAGASRGEEQRCGARAREQAQQAGATAQRQHRGRVTGKGARRSHSSNKVTRPRKR